MVELLRNMTQVVAKHVRECQEPSGLRLEGYCHSILFWLGVRLHAKRQDAGCCAHLQSQHDARWRPLLVRSLG